MEVERVCELTETLFFRLPCYKILTLKQLVMLFPSMFALHSMLILHITLLISGIFPWKRRMNPSLAALMLKPARAILTFISPPVLDVVCQS